jgi:hypothetical protein
MVALTRRGAAVFYGLGDWNGISLGGSQNRGAILDARRIGRTPIRTNEPSEFARRAMRRMRMVNRVQSGYRPAQHARVNLTLW